MLSGEGRAERLLTQRSQRSAENTKFTESARFTENEFTERTEIVGGSGEGGDCSTMKQRVWIVLWLRRGWDRVANIKATRGNARASEPVWRRKTSRPSRETARLSGWPSSEPCRAGADGQVLRCDPSACGTCSEDEPLSRNCPKRYRQRSCASGDWGVQGVLLRHRRVGRVGLREREPSSPAFQWLEQYGRFPRVKCSTVGVRCAFRC